MCDPRRGSFLTSQRSGAEVPEGISLAEEIETTSDETPVRRRENRRAVAKRSTDVAKRSTVLSRRTGRTGSPRRARKAVRSVTILAMVGGLIASVALPAYGAFNSADEKPLTLQQVALEDAQSLVVASDAEVADMSRDSYSATTQEEIDEQKAKEAAAAAAAARAEAQANSSSTASLPVDINMVSPGSGEVRWPLLNFTKGRGLWDSGYHQGVDMLAPGGTPIYAAASGVVRISSEGYYGFGVAVLIDHVINGQQVSTTYAHMTYGSRQVQAGQSVQAGQLIGLVGSTGRSTANHLHLEVHINGGVVDPWAWLVNNAG